MVSWNIWHRYGAIDLENLATQRYHGSALELKDEVSFQSFTYCDLDALDFTWVVMFVTFGDSKDMIHM